MTRELTAGQKFWQIVATVAIIVYTIIPLIWIVNLSLKPSADRADGNFWAVHPTLENYELIFTGGAKDLFLPALLNSILVTLVATLIAVILATFCAYAIAAVIPVLSSRLSDLPEDDWLERKPWICCPDPNDGVVMRLDRLDRTKGGGEFDD